MQTESSKGQAPLRKSATELLPDYDVKPVSYFEETRGEMADFIPESCRRILDVGCGSGGFGALLKKERAAEVWGVEPFESAAKLASVRLDRVIHEVFPPEGGLPLGFFDCIIFNDVLEHMTDPELALRYARTLLSPGGIVVASIPNIRHFPTIWRLVIHGEWKYRDCGTLDKTHLRFFTRSSIDEAFQREGYSIQEITGINSYRGVPDCSVRVWKLYKLINSLTRGRFGDLKFQQFAVVARARE